MPPILGQVRVRLSATVGSDAKGREVVPVTAPTSGEAIAALHRAAQVKGAERLINVSSDYRRAALAAGPLQTRWQIDVQASGTAIGPAEPASSAEESGEPNAAEGDSTFGPPDPEPRHRHE